MFLFGLAAKLVGPKFAKPFVIGGLIIFAALALWGLKSCYDSSVIENARNRGNVEALELKAKADETAARARVQDQARATTEAAELKETIDEAVAEGRSPRAAYYECIRRQQAARATGQPAPAC